MAPQMRSKPFISTLPQVVFLFVCWSVILDLKASSCQVQNHRTSLRIQRYALQLNCRRYCTQLSRKISLWTAVMIVTERLCLRGQDMRPINSHHLADQIYIDSLVMCVFNAMLSAGNVCLSVQTVVRSACYLMSRKALSKVSDQTALVCDFGPYCSKALR